MQNKVRKAIDLRYIDQLDWLEFISKGGTLSDALDIDKQELEGFYSLAYEKYTNGNYRQALPLFQLLCQCDHFDARFALGLGAVRQALKQYHLAGETYSFAALVHPCDPRFPYHAAQCHLALGNWSAAGSGFEQALICSTGKARFSDLQERAQSYVNELSIKLDKRK